MDKNYKVDYKNANLVLNYLLSRKQEEISNSVIEALNMNQNVLISAVTGSGKTELVYKAMEKYLKEGKHVGFCTPRKDVVIDLLPRISEAFPKLKVIGVYGNHNEVLEGDIIVLTSHQLSHYEGHFDLLILDEIDAFPYCGDFVLTNLFYKSIKGNYILLTATAKDSDKEGIKRDNGIVLELHRRYHGYDLPVPKFKKTYFLRLYFLYKKLNEYIFKNQQVFVFVSTISKAKLVYKFLSLFIQGGMVVSSKESNREEVISDFKNGKYSYLVTTSILERGVTVKNLQVIIFDADSNLYDSASLIQIAGRVGRKLESPTGEVILYGSYLTDDIKRCQDEIQRHNKKR